MSLLTVVLVLVLIGVLLYLMKRFIPMDATIQTIIIAVVVIAVVLWLLQIFGLLPLINSVKIGK